MAKKLRQSLRPLKIIRNYPTAAAGSVKIQCGHTHVLCTASVAEEVPKWLMDADPPQGWVTAEYAMMPGSTPERQRRGQNSRASEISRLIGRVLRGSVDMHKMPGLAITVDCDVTQADGGTRTAAITGGWIALHDAIQWAREQKLITANPMLGPVAAVSVGYIDGQPACDLDYALDVRAEVDMNIAMNHRGEFIEIQGTAEHGTYDRTKLDTMLDMAHKAVKKLIAAQRKAIR